MEEINLEAESSEPIYARPVDKDTREVNQIAASVQINLRGSLLGNHYFSLVFMIRGKKNFLQKTIFFKIKLFRKKPQKNAHFVVHTILCIFIHYANV